VKRILRKSRDFRQDSELNFLVRAVSHIDFPAYIRMPGINQEVEVRELCRLMYFRKFDEGSYIYQMGSEATTVYIVLKGACDVDYGMMEFSGSSGENVSGSMICKVGDIFGEDAGGESNKWEGKRKLKIPPPKYGGMALATSEVWSMGLTQIEP